MKSIGCLQRRLIAGHLRNVAKLPVLADSPRVGLVLCYKANEFKDVLSELRVDERFSIISERSFRRLCARKLTESSTQRGLKARVAKPGIFEHIVKESGDDDMLRKTVPVEQPRDVDGMCDVRNECAFALHAIVGQRSESQRLIEVRGELI